MGNAAYDALLRAVDRADGAFAGIERRSGGACAAVLFGCVLLGVGALYVTPELRPLNMGVAYAAASRDPLGLGQVNDLQSRLLTPLLAWAVGLRGHRFILAPLLMSVFLFAAIYLAGRRRWGLTPVESVGMAALVAFSAPLFALLRYPGYVDSTTYLLLFLAYLALPSPWWAAFWALSLFNHEIGVFLGPWLLFLAVGRPLPWRRVLLHGALFVAALALMGLYHRFLIARGLMRLSEGYYFSWSNVRETFQAVKRYAAFGIFQGFKLFWFFPIAAGVSFAASRRWRELAGLALILIGMFAQLLIAVETYRLTGFAFLAVLLGALEFRRMVGPEQFRVWLWSLIVLNFLVPSYYVAEARLFPLPSLISALFIQ